ncbi:putative cold-shock DNA-binding protein [Halospina denitrificans]|uniref:Putative cold-shock DNA-binding protein n=1 Tax=Halospina denitrificans TaxID=332522 RepID=A0A4R7JNX3_9GAMM|nr:cold shock domain-containing protein [Halospina denitrificans]TDT39424.1 putative cold-shock DNA-binding protein [Halospina denitrificans]
MHQGKVKWFNNAKGYGFIIEEGESEDLFVHFSSIQMEGYKTLKAGQRVEFEKEPSAKGIHAVNIIPLETPPKKSAQDTEDDAKGQNQDQNQDSRETGTAERKRDHVTV